MQSAVPYGFQRFIASMCLVPDPGLGEDELIPEETACCSSLHRLSQSGPPLIPTHSIVGFAVFFLVKVSRNVCKHLLPPSSLSLL